MKALMKATAWANLHTIYVHVLITIPLCAIRKCMKHRVGDSVNECGEEITDTRQHHVTLIPNYLLTYLHTYLRTYVSTYVRTYIIHI